MTPGMHNSLWNEILDDVLNADPVRDLQRDLMAECYEHKEFVSLSIDATVKCCMGFIGQGTYRTPKAERERLVANGHDPVYKLMTVRGRTAATLATHLIYSEAGEHIAAGLAQRLTAEQLAQALSLGRVCVG